MGKRESTGKKRTRAVGREAEVDALLDELDRALLGADRARADALVRQIWAAKRQVPAALAKRIMDGRAAVPAFAFDLLAGFAGERAEDYFQRIAENPAVADIVRFGAKRRMGWEQKGEAKRRLTFLGTLRDAEGTLIMAVRQATAGEPPESEILQEVLGYLVALPGERRRAVIARASDELGASVAWLLQAAMHIPDLATQRLALDKLGSLREPGAIGSIERLARTARNAQVRKEAEATARRLSMRLVGSDQVGEHQPLPPFQRVLLSVVDGDGSQVAVVVRQWEEDIFLLADIFWNDHWGVKDAFGAVHATAEHVETIVAGFKEEGIRLIEVKPAVVRGVLSQAVATNAATGHGIPPVFELWEPFVHESYPPPEGEPVVVPELDDAPYAGRDALISSSAKLAQHPFFASWGFDVEETEAAMKKAPPPDHQLTDRQYQPIIEELGNPANCTLLRQRLRCQAWLLEQTGDKKTRDLALAVAAQLAAGPGDYLAKQPFMRALVERSVEYVLMSFLFPE